MARCRSCDKPIVWMWSQNNKMMPVDPKPRDDVGEVPANKKPKTDGKFDPDYMVSHFATCPQADQHRRKR